MAKHFPKKILTDFFLCRYKLKRRNARDKHIEAVPLPSVE